QDLAQVRQRDRAGGHHRQAGQVHLAGERVRSCRRLHHLQRFQLPRPPHPEVRSQRGAAPLADPQKPRHRGTHRSLARDPRRNPRCLRPGDLARPRERAARASERLDPDDDAQDPDADRTRLRWPHARARGRDLHRHAACRGFRARALSRGRRRVAGRDPGDRRAGQSGRAGEVTMSEAVKIGRSREAFIEDLLANNYTTYFVATHPRYAKGKGAFRFTSSPVSPADPYHWSYAETRRRLFELSGLLTTEEAERRNVNFVNPGLKDFMPAATLPTLRGGIQMLLPGEKAYTHRHSANAFRTILETPAEGAYTVVEGTRIPMHPGDLVLTPNWTWHDHHNDGDSHAIWYDGLDVLMAYWIGGTFFQEYEDVSGEAYYPVKRNVDALVSTYGPGMVNRDGMLPEHIPSSDNTLLYYPYSKARKLLQGLSEAGSGNPRDGILLEYVNPLTSGP